jgi:DNA-binding NarL/FixJ family response regulator
MGHDSNNAPVAQISFDRITEAEYRILKLLDLGFSNREIAQRLGITARVAQAQMQRLYGKLEVSSRGSALAIARDRGLV